ncbi:SDR family NAD(P)-dependent oxidoreductase, partial [Nocardioides zeae]
MADLLATAREHHGRVDLVVHAVGVDDPEAKAHLRRAWGSDQPLDVFRLVTDATWRRIVSVNLDGTFHVLRAAIDVLYAQGGGAVVVSSSAAFDAPMAARVSEEARAANRAAAPRPPPP